MLESLLTLNTKIFKYKMGRKNIYNGFYQWKLSIPSLSVSRDDGIETLIISVI